MTNEELNSLVEHIRYQASTWLGDEACENIERLIKYTLSLHAQADKMAALHSEGFRLVKVEHDHK